VGWSGVSDCGADEKWKRRERWGETRAERGRRPRQTLRVIMWQTLDVIRRMSDITMLPLERRSALGCCSYSNQILTTADARLSSRFSFYYYPAVTVVAGCDRLRLLMALTVNTTVVRLPAAAVNDLISTNAGWSGVSSPLRYTAQFQGHDESVHWISHKRLQIRPQLL